MATRLELGKHAKWHRVHKGFTQEDVAKACKVATNRSAVSHLEMGIRIPKPDVLEEICRVLELPEQYWKPFTNSLSLQRFEFEEILSELVGNPNIGLSQHEHTTIEAAEGTLSTILEKTSSEVQAFDQFNSLLVYYGCKQCSRDFFNYYLGIDAFSSLEGLREAVSRFQIDAIRLYSSFSEAYVDLNTEGALDDILMPLKKKGDLSEYTNRQEMDWIDLIPEESLADLGYISAKQVRQEAAEREYLSKELTELAQMLKAEPMISVLPKYGVRKRRKIDALVRKHSSDFKHGIFSPLFSIDSDMVLREAEKVAPKSDADIARMEKTQSRALKNLAKYLTSDYMDVYVATSMRSQSDFVSVNRFVEGLFADRNVKPWKLRYFNPTQSWIDDRIAKGLVEALMLKRCSLAIYMAQEADTFGKDSEASVALGQGKPVIVYVPKLTIPELKLDVEAYGKMARNDLLTEARVFDSSDEVIDDSWDEESLLGFIVTNHISRISSQDLVTAIRRHWADFDLYSAAERIRTDDEKARYRELLDSIVGNNEVDLNAVGEMREHLIDILVSKAIRFERRANLFRAVHPLALQIILSSGVLNGILVVRSIRQCAEVLKGIVKNDLSMDLKKDEKNYMLIERKTESVVRVISRFTLLKSAFGMGVS